MFGLTLYGVERHGRVAPGDGSPRAPTDPDVRISRIRFVSSRIRYAIDGVDDASRRQRESSEQRASAACCS